MPFPHGALPSRCGLCDRPRAACWFWSNLLVIVLLFRLVDVGEHAEGAALSEILVYLYTFTILNGELGHACGR